MSLERGGANRKATQRKKRTKIRKKEALLQRVICLHMLYCGVAFLALSLSYPLMSSLRSLISECVADLPSNCMPEVAIELILVLRSICRIGAVRVWVGL